MARTIDSAHDGRHTGAGPAAVVVAARDEQRRIGATLAALRGAFPAAALWVADDGSRDATARLAREAGASVRSASRLGKGGAMTLAAREALAARPGGERDVLLLCDGDLGDSAARLGPLVEAVAGGDAELAVAVFSRRVGGGFGIARRFASWSIRRGCGARARAPLSGQRALTRGALESALPFAPGYGMEVGMTIDAVRAGARLVEIELDLSHRPTGRGPRGFLHRGAQLRDAALAFARRRGGAAPPPGVAAGRNLGPPAR